MIIPINFGERSYDIVLEAGCLKKAGEYLNLTRKVLIVTDDGVPNEYVQSIASQCSAPYVERIKSGENAKNMHTLTKVLTRMLDEGFTRGDCVAAVGGGMVGDLAGFAASCYMRGVDFYNIPTTLLSQVDSSIGGKTAVNLAGIKNIVGAFYQPKAVLIDPDTLGTLPKRHIAEGFAESVKMALTSDSGLFEIFENGCFEECPEIIIERSLRIKKDVVEQDERENGLRKILNFGHTIGHGIESVGQDPGLLHGECVAIGMLPMCSESVKERLLPVLERLGLPTSCQLDPDEVYSAVLHDKKARDGLISVVKVNCIGSFELRSEEPEALRRLIDTVVKGAYSK